MTTESLGFSWEVCRKNLTCIDRRNKIFGLLSEKGVVIERVYPYVPYPMRNLLDLHIRIPGRDILTLETDVLPSLKDMTLGDYQAAIDEWLRDAPIIKDFIDKEIVKAGVSAVQFSARDRKSFSCSAKWSTSSLLCTGVTPAAALWQLYRTVQSLALALDKDNKLS